MKLYMAIKDGIIVEQNLTEKQAGQYRGTEIKTVPQRGINTIPLYRSIVHVVPFRRRAA